MPYIICFGVEIKKTVEVFILSAWILSKQTSTYVYSVSAMRCQSAESDFDLI